MRQGPKDGLHSRWTLARLVEACSGIFQVSSCAGFCKIFKRLGFSYQRARAYVHSPDEEYEAKLAYMKQVISRYRPGEVIVLFADEVTYYNHASVARDYRKQRQQPLAKQAIGSKRTRRVAACLDCFTGQVSYIQRAKTTVPALIQLYKQVCANYPEAKAIYIIEDNWPVHFHPDILDALVDQECPFEFNRPKSWAQLKPSGKYSHLNLPIQLVTLPTYASWLNPIEKLWRWLKQQLIHNHPFAHHFKELQALVEQYLQALNKPSKEVLSFTGLLNDKGIFAEQIRPLSDFFEFGD